ncbi:adenylate kinase [Balneolales bacterium ANBcel1]|nr:adenylate kinase [Balneolales bacterium ANBcel1]
MRIIIFGPPGSGKGTQAKKVARHFEITHLSTGEIFRSAMEDSTDLGMRIKDFMDSGQLVPDQTVVDVVEQTIQNEDFQNGYIIDGFPRTMEQAVAFDDLLERRNESINAFISLHVPDDELISRMLNRGEGRSDDTRDKIRFRLKVFQEETAPVLDHYQHAGILRSVDGTGTVDEIFQRILSALPKR